jgi:hypothetical protein
MCKTIFPPLSAKKYQLNTTGSGQTQGKHSKQTVFSGGEGRQPVALLPPGQHWLGKEIRHFCDAIYNNAINDHFTKTGSGQP